MSRAINCILCCPVGAVPVVVRATENRAIEDPLMYLAALSRVYKSGFVEAYMAIIIGAKVGQSWRSLPVLGQCSLQNAEFTVDGQRSRPYDPHRSCRGERERPQLQASMKDRMPPGACGALAVWRFLFILLMSSSLTASPSLSMLVVSSHASRRIILLSSVRVQRLTPNRLGVLR